MTEAEARAWIGARFGLDAVELLARFGQLVTEENGRQNLIAPSTVASLWVRHLLDSAQLVPLAQNGTWMDIGSGGGFPGIVAGILRDEPTVLVEPRRKRAEFLQNCVNALALENRVRVLVSKVENIVEEADTVTARAVASVGKILHIAARCATRRTRWLLPRGRFEEKELNDVRHDWHFVFHVEQSLTEPTSAILVLDKVRRR